jgi:nucleotide-binding universal stress UspA family protein
VFTNVIVAVDGSESSNAAIDLAASLCKMCDARLTLCHVLHVPRPAHDAGGFAREQMMTDEVKAGHAILEAAEKRALAMGVSADKVMQTGSVAQGLFEEAKERGCDVVVMGSRGRGALARAVLGSVVSDVISRSTLPVIVAPHPHG